MKKLNNEETHEREYSFCSIGELIRDKKIFKWLLYLLFYSLPMTRSGIIRSSLREIAAIVTFNQTAKISVMFFVYMYVCTYISLDRASRACRNFV